MFEDFLSILSMMLYKKDGLLLMFLIKRFMTPFSSNISIETAAFNAFQ